MFNIAISNLSIARPATTPFRWDWYFNHWVSLMSHFPLQPYRLNLPMLNLRPTKPPILLNKLITTTNMSMIFCKNPMLSTSNAMTNAGYHTSFRLMTKSGYICRRSVSQGPIGSSTHFIMGLTLPPRLWVLVLLSSKLHPFLACTQCSMWTSFDHIFHYYWTHQRSQNN